MKILFSATHFGFLRNFQSTIRVLAEHGHELHVLAERSDAIDGQKMADILSAEHPSMTFERLPTSRHRLWYALGNALRASMDYWRYLDPKWDHSAKLRRRAADQAPPLARTLARLPLLGTRSGLALLHNCFHTLERALPPPPEVTEVFRRVNPDVLLLTPLLYFGSQQAAHVRCARRLGIKSVLGVGSWDHLTTKGLIHEIPDRVLVWNEAQKREAIALHGVPADRVVVTGSQAYDHWFSTKPALDRAGFCRKVGLDPERPMVLYLCSSPFIAPHEVGFVRSWMTAIRRSSDERLRGVSLLVRPHPQNAAQWENVDLAAEFEHAALWPKTGVNPIGGVARSDYFDSMYHAEAVVGVNTSGMIESGILGKPVYSVLTEEFASTQEGTLHFQHLKNVEGGLLYLAGSLEEHASQLSRLLADGRSERQGTRQFIQAFIRPNGLDQAATPLVVEAVEHFAEGPRLEVEPTPVGASVLRVVLAPVAVVATIATMERAKLQAIVVRWTRPARLIVRAIVRRSIYAARFVLRLPRRFLRLVGMAFRRLLMAPARWMLHQGKLRVHAFLVWRKGEPDQAP
jgi:hypothetical protein